MARVLNFEFTDDTKLFAEQCISVRRTDSHSQVDK